jgi:glycosyltransferase involved in cell wall biosynthesis
MKREPLISVLTLSYNHSAFLRKNIESVSSQGYFNYEHLIVDPGSRDGSREFMLEKKRHDPNLLLIFEPDNGPADGLHKAMQKASGEIIICLNSDDYFLPGVLNNLAKMYLARPNAAGYTANGYILYEKSGKKKFQFTDKVNSWRFSTGKLCVMHPSTAYNGAFI